jgi:hypothetical protein
MPSWLMGQEQPIIDSSPLTDLAPEGVIYRNIRAFIRLNFSVVKGFFPSR